MRGLELLVGGGVSRAAPLQVDDVLGLEGQTRQRVGHVLLDDLLDALHRHHVPCWTEYLRLQVTGLFQHYHQIFNSMNENA